MNPQLLLTEDPAYLDERRKQFQKTKEVFAKQLGHIFAIMPTPSRCLNLKTGELTIITDPKWQVLIDKHVNMTNDYLQKEFPEFNNF